MMAALLSIGVGQAQAATADGHPDPIMSTFEDTSYNRLGGEFGILSNFGLVSFNNLTMTTHTNSNIVTKNLVQSSGFGTNSMVHPEASYIAQSATGGMNVNLNNGSVLVFGSGFDVTYSGGQWAYTDGKGSNSNIDVNGSSNKAAAVQQDTSDLAFLNLDELRDQAIELNQGYRNEAVTTDPSLVTCNFGQGVDQNNRSITLGEHASRVVLDVTADDLCWTENQITLRGTNGGVQTLIINVDAAGKESIALPQFNIGDNDSHGELTEWRTTNVIFNVYDSSREDGLYQGSISNGRAVSGIVLAPDASVTSTANLNGQIIAKDITISAEFHRDSFDTSASIVARKVLDGAELQDGEFSFTLTAENNAPMPAGAKDGSLTVNNTASGSINFGSIAYTTAGEYHYIITEVIPDDAQLTHDDGSVVTYDEATNVEQHTGTFVKDHVRYNAAEYYEVTVTVSDSLVATVSYTKETASASSGAQEESVTSATFTNTYETTQPTETSLRLEGSKSITGREFKDGDAFTFVVEPQDGAPAFSDAEVTIHPSSGSTATVDFGTATFAEEGTYTYTVREVSGSADGVSYDTTAYTVTVEVTEGEDGALHAEATYAKVGGSATSLLSWTNAYTEKQPTETSLELTGSKSITGREFKDGDAFTFEAVPEGGAPAFSNAKVTIHPSSGSKAKVDFGTATFTEAGIYRYTVSEQAGSADGVTYDGTVYTVKVNVTEKDGVLSAVASYSADGSGADSLSWTNSYDKTAPAKATLTLEGSKAITGRDFQDGDSFTFTVEPQGDAPAFSNAKATVEPTSGSTCLVDFGNAEYEEEGTYTYTVREQQGSADGISYDDTIYTVTVVVKKGDDGNLTAEASYAADGSGAKALSWTNEYTKKQPTEATLKLTGSKSITGREFQDGDAFTFTAEPQDGAPTFSSPEVTIKPTSGSTAAVDFGTATFAEAGTYTYTVREQQGSADGVSYDGTVYTVTVKVTEGEDGALHASAAYTKADGSSASALSWTNTYTETAPAAASFVVRAQKRYEGGTLTAGQFTFLLTGADNAPMPDGATGNEARATNAADGSIAFGEIRYTAAGTYRYSIAEVNDGQDGVTYDSAVHETVVAVTEEGGALHATVVYDGDTSTPPTFTNERANKQQVSVSLSGTKTIAGRDFQDGDAFTFTVTPQDGAPAFSNAKVTVTPTKGTQAAVDFGTATFTEAGTYRYTVAEQAGDAAGMTYDTAVRTVVVTVSEGSDGTLSAEVAYADADGAPLEGLTWQNTYDEEKPKEKTKEKPKKKPQDNGLIQTGDMAPTVVVTLMALGGIALVAGVVTQRKHH